jgi:hypothetical protein
MKLAGLDVRDSDVLALARQLLRDRERWVREGLA